MSLPEGYIWPKVNLTEVVTHLATRCLCPGKHLTSGQPDQSSNILGHKMYLLWGQVNILLASQPTSLPAATGQTTSHVEKFQPVRLWIGQIDDGRRTGSPTTFGPQFRVPALPLLPLWGVTYLTKARQVTEMTSAALYVPLSLLSHTVYSFVSMWPNHIFLHQM